MKSFRQVFLFALIATLAVTAILVLNPLLVSSVLASLQKKVSPLQSAPASAPPKDPRYGTLVLDLAGDGVAFSSLGGRGSVYWNFTGGTVANAASWIAAGSALLAIDRNQDTIINNQTELFGNDQIDGFTALASLDTNSDHKITVADAQWQDLLVWTDTRTDGYSQPDELHHLDELGITAIDLGAQIVAYEVAGNLVTLASTFTIDGQMHEVVNATFARDKVNTVYNADFTLDARALFLPTLRGYGNLPSLHIAVSLDEQLLDLLASLATTKLSIIFGNPEGFDSDFEQLLFRWAQADAIDPRSRGPYFDARKLAFLEQFLGRKFHHQGGSPNPPEDAAKSLTRSWDGAYENMRAHLVFQIVGKQLLPHASYDPFKGALDGDLSLSQPAITDLVSKAQTAQAGPETFWREVARFLKYAHKLDALTPEETALLTVAAKSSGSTTSWIESSSPYLSP